MKSIEETAKELALAHRAEDAETQAIYLSDTSRDEVRLVEVTGSIGPSGEVLPFRFARRDDLGVPYPSVVVILSVADWERVAKHELQLPKDWGAPEQLKKVA